MIPESLFDLIMSDIVSDVDEKKTRGARGMAEISNDLDDTQANAFTKILAERAAAEPDDYVQEEFLTGLLELTMERRVDITALDPIFQIPSDQISAKNNGYIDDLREYRDLYTAPDAGHAGIDRGDL